MKLVGWRRIAGSLWGPPNDPQIYGAMEIDATKMNAFMDRARAAGHRVTPTHIVGRAVAHALHEVPDFNMRIRGGKMYQRETVDVFFITAVEGGRSLSGVKIERTDEKPIYDVAAELAERATRMKQGDDPDFAKTKKMMEAMPVPVLRASLRFSAWVAGDHDRDLKAFSVKRSPFGSAMITSVGMFGLPLGFAPLARFYKMGLLVLVGEVTDKPVAIDGKVVIRPMLQITATIDHRYADGWHISQLLKPFKAYLNDPASFESAPPPMDAALAAAETEQAVAEAALPDAPTEPAVLLDAPGTGIPDAMAPTAGEVKAGQE
jgi:pyruvate dehydrogenase E2 component (dihydrolipoamide acetyltransferase)